MESEKMMGKEIKSIKKRIVPATEVWENEAVQIISKVVLVIMK